MKQEHSAARRENPTHLWLGEGQRAKLEASANEKWPDSEEWMDAAFQAAFMAGAAAYAALLDAETTEEWGVESIGPSGVRGPEPLRTEHSARIAGAYYGIPVISRRVTPWLPSEGGEKRG